MRDKCLPKIAPACPTGGNKTLITIPLAADAVNFPTRYGRRQFRSSTTSAGPGIAGTVFASLPKLRRINAMQAQPNLTNLQRIAINRPRLALQQDGIHALGRDRRRSQAKNQQRQGNRKNPSPLHSFFPAQITRPMIFTSSVGRS